MNRRAVLAAAALAPVAGCAGLSASLSKATTAVGQVAVTVATDVTSASNLYAIAKGIGQVALATLAVTNPPAAAIINAAIAAADPVLASAGAATTQATTAASSAASTLLTSANAILLAAAPAITAVNNAAKTL